MDFVVAISTKAANVSRDDAWNHVAGVAVGQDFSGRRVQMIGGKPQFSLGKSFAGFGPVWPWLVTPDELPNADDIAISCTIDARVVQNARTSLMVVAVADLIAEFSAICELWPGARRSTYRPARSSPAPSRHRRPASALRLTAPHACRRRSREVSQLLLANQDPGAAGHSMYGEQ